MNLLLDIISHGKSYADFIRTKNSPHKSSVMSDRRSPVPSVSQGAPQAEPATRDYDIIDDEAVATTVHGTTSGPGLGSRSTRLALGRIGQVGLSVHASADKLFHKGIHCGVEAIEHGEVTETSQITKPSERDSDLTSGLARHPVDTEREEVHVHYDQHSHDNEIEFGTIMQEPETDIPIHNLPHVNCPEKIVRFFYIFNENLRLHHDHVCTVARKML